MWIQFCQFSGAIFSKTGPGSVSHHRGVTWRLFRSGEMAAGAGPHQFLRTEPLLPCPRWMDSAP
jgi:hypothetical protein